MAYPWGKTANLLNGPRLSTVAVVKLLQVGCHILWTSPPPSLLHCHPQTLLDNLGNGGKGEAGRGDKGTYETTLWASRGLPGPSSISPLLVMYRVSQHEQLQYSGPINLFTLASAETMPVPHCQATTLWLSVVYVFACVLQLSSQICPCRTALAHKVQTAENNRYHGLGDMVGKLMYNPAANKGMWKRKKCFW